MAKQKDISKIFAEVFKKHGDGSLVTFGGDNPVVDVERVDMGIPSLDYVLGGGMPEGRVLEVYGPESSGKTTLCLHTLAKFQEKHPNKYVAFIDIENALDKTYAETLGVDMERLLVSQPDSGEQALDIVEKLCKSEQVSAIVIDSVAQLVPMAVAEKDIDATANIATTARLLSQAVPRLGLAASKHGVTLLFINQIRMMIGVMYGNPETTPGGKILKFASSIRLEVRGKKAEEREGVMGMPVKITAKKNKTAIPFRFTEVFLEYGKGFDALGDKLDVAMKLGIIEKAGGWFSYKDLKVQGWKSFVEELKQHESYVQDITTTLKEFN